MNRRNELLQKQGEKLASVAKTKWYNEGEKSNKYFLNLLKRQTDRNEMTSLLINGVEVTNETHIKNYVKFFYQELYNHNRDTEIADDLFEHMFTVEQADNDHIKSDITLAELWATLKPLKATTPGPDGISNLYLKKLWDIIGPLILDSWKNSILRGELPPSHKNSILRLIPKAGKNTKELKNWRPITLSNCDHKLITKTYNNRLVNTIKNHIINTQTAYLNGRNISDNLRLVNALTKAAEFNSNIDATVIALDAQKAFDSVNHTYIEKVLERVGLNNFVPIFQLLYRDLENDILINGQLGSKFQIKNGVKQGDSLNCSLFILAIEPVIRNIEHNTNITEVKCNCLNFSWPKALAYADDISVITNNNDVSVQGIFTEYWKLTKASGLYLNADKTEKYNVHNDNVNGIASHIVTYGNDIYTIVNQEIIKINGIYFSNDAIAMADANANAMTNKMNNHFAQWSRRSLLLLGKVQIIKTFGLSQFLYTLSVVDLLPEHWKHINHLVSKFIVNRNYAGNRAPNRIKNDIIYNDTNYGGFGMVKLDEVTNCIRLIRFAILEEGFEHPVRNLQLCLGSSTHLHVSNPYDRIIDPTTSTASKMISEHNIRAYAEYDVENLESDRLFRLKLCGTKLVNIIPRNKHNSRTAARLRRLGVYTLHELLEADDIDRMEITNICKPELIMILRRLLTMPHLHHNYDDVAQLRNHHLYDSSGYRWLNVAVNTSSKLRQMIYNKTVITDTKAFQFDPGGALTLYSKLRKISSIALRTKMLRLIHSDVYCGTRLVKFGLSEIDTCIRCFEHETINHLLFQCPYSQIVWTKLGITVVNFTSILHGDLAEVEIELRCAIIDMLVFRKTQIPPAILIENVLKSYATGLSKKKKMTDFAVSTRTLYELYGAR
jgi:hypothetical protein